MQSHHGELEVVEPCRPERVSDLAQQVAVRFVGIAAVHPGVEQLGFPDGVSLWLQKISYPKTGVGFWGSFASSNLYKEVLAKYVGSSLDLIEL